MTPLAVSACHREYTTVARTKVSKKRKWRGPLGNISTLPPPMAMSDATWMPEGTTSQTSSVRRACNDAEWWVLHCPAASLLATPVFPEGAGASTLAAPHRRRDLRTAIEKELGVRGCVDCVGSAVHLLDSCTVKDSFHAKDYYREGQTKPYQTLRWATVGGKTVKNYNVIARQLGDVWQARNPMVVSLPEGAPAGHEPMEEGLPHTPHPPGDPSAEAGEVLPWQTLAELKVKIVGLRANVDVLRAPLAAAEAELASACQEVLKYF